MQKFYYPLKTGTLNLFIAFFLLILLVGPVMHNHPWQIFEPTQCPAFLLEQVLTSVVGCFLLVILINLAISSPFFGFEQFLLKEFRLTFVQANRPPPVTI
jgi:hypothetical protein